MVTSLWKNKVVIDTLNTFPVVSNFWTYDYVEASNFMIDTCDENIIAMYHFTDEGRVMGSIDGAKKLTQTVKTSKYTTKDNEEIGRIHVSLLTSSDKAIDENSYAYELAEISGGIVYSGTSQVKSEPMAMRLVLEDEDVKTETTEETNGNLIEILGEGGLASYRIITSTGSTKGIQLDAVLKKGSKTDSDDDGLYDWDEVNVGIVEKYLGKNFGEIDMIKNSDLPTIKDLTDHSFKWESWKSYIGGIEGYVNRQNQGILDTVAILPILSDPRDKDSDGDGFLDNAYINPNAKNENDKIPYDWVKKSDKYVNISDPHPLKKEIIWQWPAYYSDGTAIDRLQSAFGEKRDYEIHNGIDITPIRAENQNCYVVAAYNGRVSNMILNHNGAGYYIEIEHNINSKKYISRYLHLEAFEGSELYKRYQENKNKTYVKAGDVIGIISGTPYINNKLRYPKHLHYTLCLGSVSAKIDPICFNNPEIMFMDIPSNLKPTCDDKCQSCKNYFKKIAQKYKLDWENWGD